MTMVSVIVPTYNEQKNMGPLIRRIDGSIKGMEHEIIVVDDNSQDGTAQTVRELSKKYPVRLISRTNEKGLATAVIEGFKHAKGDIYAVIDADLQHPPETLKLLIYAACNGSDIAIGSRYVGEKGKERFGGFRIHRKIMSKGANVLAKLLVPKVAGVQDIQSGFFAMKKSVIQDVELKPTGYKILLEILALGNYNIVEEVPYNFGKREHGTSKLGATTVFSYLYHIMTLTFREKESKRLMKFIASGAASIVFSVGLLWVMTDIMGIFYITSGAISKEIGIVFAFALSEFWVFDDRIAHSSRTAKRSISRLLQFNINRLLSIVIVTVCMAIFTEFVGLNYIVSNMIGIAIAFPFNYVVSNKSIWKDNGTSKNADMPKNTDESKIVYMPESAGKSKIADIPRNMYTIRDADAPKNINKNADIPENTDENKDADIPESTDENKDVVNSWTIR